MLVLQYLFLCIILVLFVSFARETYEFGETFMAMLGCVVVPVALVVLLCMNLAIQLTIAIRIIQCVAIGICLILIVCYMDDMSYSGCTFWAVIWLTVFIIISGFLFFDEITHTSEDKVSKKETISKISWDYSNPQIVTTEYMIVGTSDETIIVNVSYNGENTLRSIPFEEIIVKYDDSLLKPYVYRENTIYTEYDYGKEPPEALRQDSSTWSKYILCGTKQQIQALFGYEETFNFEQ